MELSTKQILLEALLNDEPFKVIREKIGVGKKYNLAYLCEYEGGKIWRAFQLHKNNQKSNTSSITQNIKPTNITPEKFLIALDERLEKLISNTFSNTPQITYDEIEVIELPKHLPDRLTGENRKAIKQTSIKIVENVWTEFQEYSKDTHYGSIELLSLALLEFLEKYRVR